MTCGHEYLAVAGLVSFDRNLLYYILVSARMEIHGVLTWSEVLIYKDAIVLVISGIVILVLEHTCYVVVAVSFNHLVLSIAQYHFRTIDRMILVVGTWLWLVEVVSQLFIFGTDITHDISFFLGSTAEPCLDTTIVADTLLTTPVWVHRAVTRWTIDVEIALYQETRITVLQYAEVTGITIDSRLATHLGNITIDTWVAHCPVGLELHTIIVDNKGVRPSRNRHLITILYRGVVIRTAHGTAIEIRWVVHQCVSIVISTCCIGVYRDKVVCTPAFALLSDDRKLLVILAITLLASTTSFGT